MFSFAERNHSSAEIGAAMRSTASPKSEQRWNGLIRRSLRQFHRWNSRLHQEESSNDVIGSAPPKADQQWNCRFHLDSTEVRRLTHRNSKTKTTPSHPSWKSVRSKTISFAEVWFRASTVCQNYRQGPFLQPLFRRWWKQPHLSRPACLLQRGNLWQIRQFCLSIHSVRHYLCC